MAQTSKDIVDVAAGSKDHSTLVAAIKAADLVNTLKALTQYLPLPMMLLLSSLLARLIIC